MKKRKDECLFCTSRKCCNRVVTRDMTYDEIACVNHRNELYKHSDDTIPGVMRLFSETTGTYKRGEKINWDELEVENNAAL